MDQFARYTVQVQSQSRFCLIKTENPLAIFCVALVGGAVLEYSASFIMEKLFHVRWWDYSEKAININGRICMSSILSFGLAGILIVEVTTPFFYGLFDGLYSPILLVVAAILFAWLICDIALSLWLMFGVRITADITQADATEEISHRAQKFSLVIIKKSRRNLIIVWKRLFRINNQVISARNNLS